MVDGVTKKEWRTLWKKQALLYIYILFEQGLVGLKTQTDYIYDVILQREDACGTLGELRNADTDF